ncbi:Hypothetical predicted protein [Mytilus galloprovincialis]|uniref:LRRCT domain-containing protein n=1 Tax=Mytilus galloprovincialis TaxID=29158 RepID=A0A8B6DU67_MYTGA|nr:Hypothetical predicted protein [Mytilus galloprovincialis]
MSVLSNLLKLGFTLGTFLSASFKYPLSLYKNPIRSDCKFGRIIKHIKSAAKNFEGVRRIICKDPPLLRGERIFNISEDLFTCDISMENKCPPECNSYEQPSRSRVVVNCSSTRKHKMPSFCPQQDDLDINFSHNFISVFEYRTYLNRTYSINLSYNRIASVDPFIYGIKKLRNINIQHNEILQIHKNIRLMTNEQHISFGNISIKCSCEMKWIEVWLENQNRRHGVSNSIICHIQGRYIEAITMSEICSAEKPRSAVQYVLLSIVIAIYISLLLCFKMKYELFLLLREFKSLILNRYNDNENLQPNVYAVYISFDAENDNIMKWIKTVVFNLEKKTSKCVCPQEISL